MDSSLFDLSLFLAVFKLKYVVSLLKVSKLSLVDLAGSERADATGAKGERLKVCECVLVVLHL